MQLDFGETHLAPEVDTVAGAVLVWAPDWQVFEAIEASLNGVGHAVRRLEDDAELATAHHRDALKPARVH